MDSSAMPPAALPDGRTSPTSNGIYSGHYGGQSPYYSPQNAYPQRLPPVESINAASINPMSPYYQGGGAVGNNRRPSHPLPPGAYPPSTADPSPLYPNTDDYVNGPQESPYSHSSAYSDYGPSPHQTLPPSSPATGYNSHPNSYPPSHEPAPMPEQPYTPPQPHSAPPAPPFQAHPAAPRKRQYSVVYTQPPSTSTTAVVADSAQHPQHIFVPITHHYAPGAAPSVSTSLPPQRRVVEMVASSSAIPSVTYTPHGTLVQQSTESHMPTRVYSTPIPSTYGNPSAQPTTAALPDEVANPGAKKPRQRKNPNAPPRRRKTKAEIEKEKLEAEATVASAPVDALNNPFVKTNGPVPVKEENNSNGVTVDADTSALMPPPRVAEAPSVIAAAAKAANVPSAPLPTAVIQQHPLDPTERPVTASPPKRVRNRSTAQQQRLKQQKLIELQAAEEREYIGKYMHLRRTVRALLFKNGALADEVARLKMQINVVTEERKLIAKRVQHHERNRIRRVQNQERKALQRAAAAVETQRSAVSSTQPMDYDEEASRSVADYGSVNDQLSPFPASSEHSISSTKVTPRKRQRNRAVNIASPTSLSAPMSPQKKKPRTTPTRRRSNAAAPVVTEPQFGYNNSQLSIPPRSAPLQLSIPPADFGMGSGPLSSSSFDPTFDRGDVLDYDPILSSVHMGDTTRGHNHFMSPNEPPPLNFLQSPPAVDQKSSWRRNMTFFSPMGDEFNERSPPGVLHNEFSPNFDSMLGVSSSSLGRLNNSLGNNHPMENNMPSASMQESFLSNSRIGGDPLSVVVEPYVATSSSSTTPTSSATSMSNSTPTKGQRKRGNGTTVETPKRPPTRLNSSAPNEDSISFRTRSASRSQQVSPKVPVANTSTSAVVTAAASSMQFVSTSSASTSPFGDFSLHRFPSELLEDEDMSDPVVSTTPTPSRRTPSEKRKSNATDITPPETRLRTSSRSSRRPRNSATPSSSVAADSPVPSTSASPTPFSNSEARTALTMVTRRKAAEVAAVSKPPAMQTRSHRKLH